jgi:hypothetical protein
VHAGNNNIINTRASWPFVLGSGRPSSFILCSRASEMQPQTRTYMDRCMH